MNHEAKQIVKRIYEAFASGDLPTVLESFDPQIAWHAAENSPAAPGSPHLGPDAVKLGVFQLIAEEFPGMVIELDELIATESGALGLGYYRGTRKSTGRAFRVQLAHLWTIRDGKVIRFQQYVDTLALAEAGRPS